MKIFLGTANANEAGHMLTGRGLQTLLHDGRKARPPLGEIIVTAVPKTER